MSRRIWPEPHIVSMRHCVLNTLPNACSILSHCSRLHRRNEFAVNDQPATETRNNIAARQCLVRYHLTLVLHVTCYRIFHENFSHTSLDSSIGVPGVFESKEAFAVALIA
jgi:hypothetical protein